MTHQESVSDASRRQVVLGALAFALVNQRAAGATKAAGGTGRMKTIAAGVLDVAYLEWGSPDGAPVILLHGFPYDAHVYDAAAEQLASAGRRCLAPFLRGHGATRFRDPTTFRSGQQAALGGDLVAFMDALAIPRAVLAGYDWGGRAACVVAALHPERVRGLVSCGTGYNIQDSETATKPVSPDKEHRYWYWYYLNSERGRTALSNDRTRLCRFLWTLFSPTWAFDEATFARTAAAFDNPDFVDVVLHSYRYRIGSVAGDPALQPIERQLAAKPKITVPTIVLEGKDDGVDPPAPDSDVRPHFTRLRELKVVAGAGHNLPQEAPDIFAAAVLAL